jgi:hypothetical protein
VGRLAEPGLSCHFGVEACARTDLGGADKFIPTVFDIVKQLLSVRHDKSLLDRSCRHYIVTRTKSQ